MRGMPRVWFALAALSAAACHQSPPKGSIGAAAPLTLGQRPVREASLPPTPAPDTSAAPESGLGVYAIAQISEVIAGGSWDCMPFHAPFGLHPIGDKDAYVSYGLHLGHVEGDGVTFSPELSRGLPIQTDPCLEPIVGEIHRERSGRLVLTLAASGSSKFGIACRVAHRDPAGIAYAWTGTRWVPIDLPGWAESPTRRFFQEIRWAGKTVRLMGPRVVPTDDGSNPPEDSEHLSSCFGERRPTLEGWDLPEGLPSLPQDLCVEAIALGATATDRLLFGRTQDGAMWLERWTPAAPPVRARVTVPAWCGVLRSSHDQTWLGGVGDGELVVRLTCRKSEALFDVEERAFSYQYGSKAGRFEVVPVDAPAMPPHARERVDLGQHYELERASTRPPPIAAYDDTPRASPVLLYGGRPVLSPACEAVVIGEKSALAETQGQAFLIQPWELRRWHTPAAVEFHDHALAPDGKFLSLPTGSAGCHNGMLLFARLPAGDHLDTLLERVRQSLAELVREHAVVAGGPEHFVEFRIGDEVLVGRHWAEVQPSVPWERPPPLQRRVREWVRAKGLSFETTCIFQYPSGEGRTYHFDATGRIEWIDRARAVLVPPPR